MDPVSLKNSLPKGYDATQGLRGLRVRDQLPISVKSMTSLVSRDRAPASDLSTGHVYSNKVALRIWGDGSWWFQGNVSDTSVLYGDNFAIGFVFQDGGWAGVKTGSLGAEATRTPQHMHFAIHGRDEGLQRNFWQIVGGELEFRLYRSDDLSQVFDDIVTDLKHVWQKIELLVSYDSSAQGSSGSSGPPDNGGPPSQPEPVPEGQ